MKRDLFIAWLTILLILFHIQSCAHGESPITDGWAFDAIGYKEVAAVPKKCGRTTTVAVIDTGIDYANPFFNGSLIPNVGWNFFYTNKLPLDTNQHGTRVSSIIISTARMGLPTCNAIQLMTLKYYDNSLWGDNLTNTINAIRYATTHNVQLINYSSGGNDSNATERDAIEYAASRGIIIVTAAGNNSSNAAWYPAAYEVPNVIGVASVDKTGGLSNSSNFGTRIPIAAPGVDVLALSINNKYETVFGTSIATPFVAGAVAWLMSQSVGPVWPTVDELRKKLQRATKEVKGNEKHNLVQWGSLYLPKLINP